MPQNTQQKNFVFLQFYVFLLDILIRNLDKFILVCVLFFEFERIVLELDVLIRYSHTFDLNYYEFKYISSSVQRISGNCFD